MPARRSLSGAGCRTAGSTRVGDDRKVGLLPEQWLLMEWPTGAVVPSGYWLASLPAKTSLRRLVGISKHRWVIERDYQELKQELGLGH